MDPVLLRLAVFLAFSVLSLGLGYTARRTGAVREEVSRGVHWVTVVVVWSLIMVATLWKLPVTGGLWWVLVVTPMTVAVPPLVAIPLARLMRADRGTVGVIAIASAIGNTGYLMGASVCNTLLAGTDEGVLLPEEAAKGAADAAMAYGMAVVNVMSICGIFILYPLARCFGEQDAGGAGGVAVWRLVMKNFTDPRAAMFYAAGLGAVLSATGVPYPEAVDDWYVLEVLLYLGALGTYFGIGMRLRFGGLWRPMRWHVVVAGFRFGFALLLTAGLLGIGALMGFKPSPLLRDTLLIEAMVPLAAQAVIIPNLFGMDAAFASRLWIVNTGLFVVVVLPVLWLVFSA
ncbi:MAG: hypothetical protein AAF797_02640 [Planctomycetota bacterium]